MAREPDAGRFFGGGAEGYTSYPSLEDAERAPLAAAHA